MAMGPSGSRGGRTAAELGIGKAIQILEAEHRRVLAILQG